MKVHKINEIRLESSILFSCWIERITIYHFLRNGVEFQWQGIKKTPEFSNIRIRQMKRLEKQLTWTNNGGTGAKRELIPCLSHSLPSQRNAKNQSSRSAADIPCLGNIFFHRPRGNQPREICFACDAWIKLRSCRSRLIKFIRVTAAHSGGDKGSMLYSDPREMELLPSRFLC